MNNWKKYAVCKCGFKIHAPFGDLFFVHLSCCPKCGVAKPTWPSEIIMDKNWKIKTMRFIFTGKWYNPFTWNNGYWETKK